MHIVLTGATGFLGTHLAKSLLNDGHDVSAFVRNPEKCRTLFAGKVASFSSWHEAPVSADAVINLAGEPLVGTRWTSEKKDRIRASRLSTTQGIIHWLDKMQMRPEIFLSGSAIGYYGFSDSENFTEASPQGDDFGARLCHEWESAAQVAKKWGIRVVCLRTGVVLSKRGGALQKMLPAFKLGLGGPIATGTQYFSWIHLQDWIDAVRFLLRSEHLNGPFNLCSPNPVTNQVFAQQLSQQLSRPHFLRTPAWALKLLFGEGADLLIKGQKVSPARLQESGFVFQHSDLSDALSDLLS